MAWALCAPTRFSLSPLKVPSPLDLGTELRTGQELTKFARPIRVFSETPASSKSKAHLLWPQLRGQPRRAGGALLAKRRSPRGSEWGLRGPLLAVISYGLIWGCGLTLTVHPKPPAPPLQAVSRDMWFCSSYTFLGPIFLRSGVWSPAGSAMVSHSAIWKAGELLLQALTEGCEDEKAGFGTTLTQDPPFTNCGFGRTFPLL